jgi:hypothetical protein
MGTNQFLGFRDSWMEAADLTQVKVFLPMVYSWNMLVTRTQAESIHSMHIYNPVKTRAKLFPRFTYTQKSPTHVQGFVAECN